MSVRTLRLSVGLLAVFTSGDCTDASMSSSKVHQFMESPLVAWVSFGCLSLREGKDTREFLSVVFSRCACLNQPSLLVHSLCARRPIILECHIGFARMTSALPV